MNKLSQEEANELINALKRKIEEKIFYFPHEKGRLEFNVLSDDEKEFVVTIQRKGIRNDSCTYQGRLINGTVLMRLDINPTAKHFDKKTGQYIIGPHLHIYSEEYGNEAIPFDVNNKNLYELCFEFFKKFNVVELPEIYCQNGLK